MAAGLADREWPSATTKMLRDAWINRFLAAVGLRPGYAWCAAFVYKILIRAGADPKKLPPRGHAAAVRRWAAWAKVNGYLVDKPQRGDLMYWLNSPSRMYGHIEFVSNVQPNGDILCIGGNTNSQGSRTGNGIFRPRRTMAFLQSKPEYGFIRLPDYLKLP